MPRTQISVREKLLTLFESLPHAEAVIVYELLGYLLKTRRPAAKPVVAKAPAAKPAPAVAAAPAAVAATANALPPAAVAAKKPRVRKSRAKKAAAAAATAPFDPNHVQQAMAPAAAQGDGDPGLVDSYDDAPQLAE